MSAEIAALIKFGQNRISQFQQRQGEQLERPVKLQVALPRLVATRLGVEKH
jgi:hypothetical protein